MIEEVKLVIGMAVLQYGNLRIDPNQRRVYVNEQVVELTTMEFNILYYLAFPFVLICVPHNNTPSTGCPVKGVHIKPRQLRFLFNE